MKEFLAKKLQKKPGKIIDLNGNILGEHEGAFSFTIGQRKGIKIGGGPALFVVAKDTQKNKIWHFFPKNVKSLILWGKFQICQKNIQPKFVIAKKIKYVTFLKQKIAVIS